MRVCARHPERSRRMLMEWYVKVKHISTTLNVTAARHAEHSQACSLKDSLELITFRLRSMRREIILSVVEGC